MLDTTSPFVLDWRNAVGLAVSVLVAFISGPGGQGGGSFYIVIFSVLLGFSTNQASALSAAVVFFGCITMFGQALFTAHPQRPSLPVIDYTLVLAMTPSLIVGLALGVLLNAAISQWLLNLLIIAIWTWSSIRLCFSYRKARVAEKLQQQQQQQQEAESVTEKGPGELTSAAALEVVVCCSGSSLDGASEGEGSGGCGSCMVRKAWAKLCGAAAKGGGAVRTWASIQPWWHIAAIALLFSVFIACQVVQGAVTPACSKGYWAVLAALCGIGAVAALAVSAWLLRCSSAQQQSAVAPDVLPTTAHTVGSGSAAAVAADAPATSTSAATSFSLEGGAAEKQGAPSNDSAASAGQGLCWRPGLLASINVQMIIAGLMLGAWPLSPIILALPGMHPQVGAATSKVMLFMITAGAGLSFIASGNINLTYMLIYGLTNAVATPIGVWVVDRWIKRSGRPSCIIMLTIVRLMACVVLQAVLQAAPSLVALAHGLPRAGFLPKPLCKPRVL